MLSQTFLRKHAVKLVLKIFSITTVWGAGYNVAHYALSNSLTYAWYKTSILDFFNHQGLRCRLALLMDGPVYYLKLSPWQIT